MATDQTYRIDLQDLFSGPLDLLLFLVRKHELDILDISLSQIITQFQDYLEVLELIDFDMAADFVVIASTLTEIKSRLVLIRTTPEEEEEEEVETDFDANAPNEGLVEKLLEYKRLKDAAQLLQDQALGWQDRYPRLADERPDTKRSPADDFIKDVEVWDLVGTFARIVRKRQSNDVTRLHFDATPVHLYVEQIGKKVRAEGKVLFQSLFEQTADKSQIIGMFLAVLELVRHHKFRALQMVDYGEIWIHPPKDNSDLDDPVEKTNPDQQPDSETIH